MTERFIPRALVDMDGVVFDFDGEVRARLKARHPEVQPLQRDRPDFYIANNYPKQHQDKVWGIINEPGFFEALPLVPDATHGVGRLIEAGFDVRICSTLLPEEYAPYCRDEKITALIRHFGAQVIKTAIFTPNKPKVDGVALIDDKPPELIEHSEEARWTQIIFDQAYNRTSSKGEDEGYLRLSGWTDPDLPEILEEAKKRYWFKISRTS